mmetsp:Transcript_106074/g.265692  ORF Transcript_106074/g.265692 Transcript_106074/m.265692 type:complete len:218 (-) Transcript_106074:3237-3890(-)
MLHRLLVVGHVLLRHLLVLLRRLRRRLLAASALQLLAAAASHGALGILGLLLPLRPHLGVPVGLYLVGRVRASVFLLEPPERVRLAVRRVHARSLLRRGPGPRPRPRLPHEQRLGRGLGRGLADGGRLPDEPDLAELTEHRSLALPRHWGRAQRRLGRRLGGAEQGRPLGDSRRRREHGLALRLGGGEEGSLGGSERRLRRREDPGFGASGSKVHGH